MRGPPAASRTRQMPESNEARAGVYSHPAPYDGWNARGNLAAMSPTQAILMDNVFPGVQNVTLRPGCIDWATAAPATVHSFLPYNGITTNKLFAATDANIYDITAQGAFPAASVTGLGGGYWQSLMISTSGGNFLFAVNGVNGAILFDGTTWTTPTITGVASSTWNYITLHKHRIWAIQENSMNLWYLPTDSIAGAASQFAMGGLFKKGGHLVAIGTWSFTYGVGIDQFFVIVTSAGEIALYQGTDPASASTWALVGIFDVARPVGTKPLFEYGGDMLYLSATGVLPLSKLLQSVVLDRSQTISTNIDGAFLDAIAAYNGNLGWQMLTHKMQNALIVNVPVVQDSSAVQFVMNTTTRAWCRFTNWNAQAWVEFNGSIYYATGVKVCKAWVGTNDSGNPIVGQVSQAYTKLGTSAQKHISLVRPNVGFTGPAELRMALDADFNTFAGQTIFTYAPTGAGGIWGINLWDNCIWDSGVSMWQPRWATVPGDLGYLHSFRLQITASSGNFIWTSTDFALVGAGIL